MIVRREPRPLGQSEGEIWSQIVRDPFSITRKSTYLQLGHGQIACSTGPAVFAIGQYPFVHLGSQSV